jgi:hypothetical protein
VIRQIQALLQRTPFQPFIIVSTSGQEYRVDHPENAAILGGLVVVALEGEGVASLAGLHIAAVKDLAADAAQRM